MSSRGLLDLRGGVFGLRDEAAVTTLTLFVPGRLINPLNGSWGHWSKHARLAQAWRDRTSLACYQALRTRRLPAWLYPPSAPKVITFLVQTGAPWDDDALPAAVKPIRDELVSLGIIHADSKASGHRFDYDQVVKRYDRGVTITVERLT